MNDKQLFDTKAQAQAEINTMRGWVAKATPVLVYDEDGNEATRYGIMCKQGKTSLWLRQNGYVR